MEFLGIGYQEVLLILVLLLVFVGPERLPGMAYQIGKAVRTMQEYARQVRDEFSDEFTYIEEQYKTVKGEVDSTRETMRAESAKMNADLREVTQPIRLAPTGTDPAGSTATNNVVSINDGRPIDTSGITIVSPTDDAPAASATAVQASVPERSATPPAPPLLF
ncbi:MAG TPA: Sec-independent protein translocase protein TatB [Tepidiformaceae bacterium]|nr:Sec-independent protein translocase protein TatB [Tepidiformaceae bacterium]